jgi:hypothetical protein
MSKVCPQRIIAEAVELLNATAGLLDEDLEERVINSVQELQGLSRALYRDGIHNIEEMP